MRNDSKKKNSKQEVEPSGVVHALRGGQRSHHWRTWEEQEGGVTETQYWVSKKQKEEALLAVEVRRASPRGCFYFFQCDFSLPPSQTLSASLRGICVLKGHPSGLSEVGVLQVR